MTLTEVYQNGREELRIAGIESPSFDAVSLFYKAFGLDRQGLILHGMEEADTEKTRCYQEDIRQRAFRQPLQYLLGKWEFLDFVLEVGKGVLVPREETELLVKTAAEMLEQTRKGWENPEKQPLVLDLCAGTGAVGIGVISLVPDAKVTCVEWYNEAIHYLKQNIVKCGGRTIEAVKADVLAEPDCFFTEQIGNVDMIVSNPPYIKTKELAGLQQEVQQEPKTALDGGNDGLLFYHKIVRNWSCLLIDGGVMAVEIGETQGQVVKALFEFEGFSRVEIKMDFNGLDRVVCGIKYK